MTITSPKLPASHLTINEEAVRRCENALRLKDKGDYDGARRAMGDLWNRAGERPQTKELHPSVTAEVLLCVGILTRWIGSKNRVEGSQETAKNLITESITFYESTGDIKKVAAARVELACCYWREGGLDEARITLNSALQKLTTEGNTRARALLRLAIIEWSASRYRVGLKILEDSSELFKKITNQTLKGTYHNQLAMIYQELATSEKRDDYFQRAISEYEEADHYFRLAHNNAYRADVKNNVGMLLYELSRFKEAHEYLEHARRLTLSFKDKIGIAQIDDTRAQVLIAQRKLKEAESVARGAVRVLEKSGHQCLLTDALITQGIALARLKQTEHAQYIFQKAIEVAHQVGAFNKAGLAALTMIEELPELSRETLSEAYDGASEWLATSQSQDLLSRVNTAARKVFSKLRGESQTEPANVEDRAEDAIQALRNKPCHFPSEVLKFEGSLIRQALAKVDGRLTQAASLLGMSYQALAYIIEGRHKDLLKERTPIRRRPRKKAA
jgi:tetratricopeptide (TPR) repeat protein